MAHTFTFRHVTVNAGTESQVSGAHTARQHTPQVPLAVVYAREMRLNAVGITCSNIEASLGFYALLGVAFGAFEVDSGHYEADLGGGVRIMLDSEEVMASFVDDFQPPRGNDRISLAVEMSAPQDVDALYLQVVNAGHLGIREPFDAFWGQRYATVADPDGNHVDLYAGI